MTWYEGTELVIFSKDKARVINRIKTNGNQDFGAVLEGFVTYQTEDEIGNTILSRYEIATGKILSAKSFLGQQTFSAYGNENYLVLTGDGDKILMVDLAANTIKELKENSEGLGYYQAKINGSGMSAMQYATDGEAAMPTGTLFHGSVGK